MVLKLIARPKTFLVPVSGGKDSQACLRLAIEKHGKENIRALHQYTGFDHPATYEHMKYMEERYGVKIEMSKSHKYEDIFKFIKAEGYFPNMAARGCTKTLKQQPFARWLVEHKMLGVNKCHIYFGMRASESRNRGNKYGQLSSDDVFSLQDLSDAYSHAKYKHITVSLPIVTWAERQVFQYLAKHGDKVNKLYSKGHHRVGCYPCLLARKDEWEAAVQDPTGKKHIDKLLEIERDFAKNPPKRKDGEPMKLIRIHEYRDIEALRKTGTFAGLTQFEGLDDKEDTGGCSFCNF